MKTCFVSAPANVNLSALRSVLLSKGIEVKLPFETKITGSSFKKQIENAIDKAEYFFAVLTEGANANVMFELGYASARKRQIAILQCSDGELPPNLYDFATVKVDLNNSRLLSLALDDVLHEKKASKISEKQISKTKPLSTLSIQMLQHLRNLQTNVTEQELVSIITTVFKDSNIQVIAQPPIDDKGYDFALWLDELQSLVGNPLLVELKTRLTAKDAKHIKEQFLNRKDFDIGKGLLVVYVKGVDEEIAKENYGAPLILFSSLETFLTELEQCSLGEIIKTRRNQLVHGI